MDSTQRPVHLSQVDELYEGYCIQCRLRDGASNMQRAFSRCPPIRASRESLQELGRSLQECIEVRGQWGTQRAAYGGGCLDPEEASLSVHPPPLPGPLAGRICMPWAGPRATLCGALQDMWLIEAALEVHLGEFHIRMKGNRAESGRGWKPVQAGASGLLGGPGTFAGWGFGQNPRAPGKTPGFLSWDL